ncbi:MAG: hypothetical protein LQ342_001744 [Letrouitia transgressa]|nr:MAG: hypothetical protein LQ342_001744 [Letrouitia transgressa]
MKHSQRESNSHTKAERARRYLSGGGIIREDSDDELGLDDHPWEWIYSDTADNKYKDDPRIIGARMGGFECRIGDCCLLKAEGNNEAWVGIIFYITPSWDVNPLASINGKADIVSPAVFRSKFPSGKVSRNSKGYGKTFICRRGCNTRTATYTDEFVWEDIYSGAEALLDLIDHVKSQTKATRKRKRASDDAGIDYDPAREIELPKTPSKRRKLSQASTPTPKHIKRTPQKLLTPTQRRVIVKKPLEFTPLGTRILSPQHTTSSPFQIARNSLHVSSVPDALPCRSDEFSTVYAHLEAAISAGSGACIYISGTPGTGKTATVREVVAQLNASVLAEELDDFIFVEINGMKVTDPHQSYSLLWQALRDERVSPSHALGLLERDFDRPNPRRVPCVVLMDELDQLVTKNQSVMYNFFNWPGLRHSRLIVLAVANTMDLPERTLSNKISSRLGYTHNQLQAIITSRLCNVPDQIVEPDAVQFASRKVAAVSGDARRALDICRRAVEIAEADAATVTNPLLATPSKPKRLRENRDDMTTKPKHNTLGKVTISTIKQAINEATSSPLQQHLRALPLSSKLFLAAILARTRRSGVSECVMGDVIEEAKRLGLMATDNADISDILLKDGLTGWRRQMGTNATPSKKEVTSEKTKVKAPRALGMRLAASALAEAGIIGLEGRRGERIARVRLGVGEEEIKLALKDDEEVQGLGFM